MIFVGFSYLTAVRAFWRSTFMRIDVVLFLLSVLFFLSWPHFDLEVTGLFFSAGQFFLKDHILVRFIYDLFGWLLHIALLLFTAGIIYCSIFRKSDSRHCWVFLLVCLIAVPGLAVNTVLKDNSTGRPRPRDVVEFGGNADYTAPFSYSGVCKHNCSFVSGHAASGFFVMVLAWAMRNRRWLYIGIATGAIVGFVRIVQGGHFFSDVIFAGWVSYFLFMAIARLMSLLSNHSALKHTNHPHIQGAN